VRRDQSALSLCTAVLLSGCSGRQSALDPAGPSAASIHLLGIFMYVGAALVTLLVTVLMLLPFLRRRESPVNHNLFLWGGGVALPFFTLVALVPYVMTVGHETRAAPAPDRLTIDVTGSLWWWEMAYQRTGGVSAVASANELRLPAGEPVELLLHANDVIHSFWVPNLAGKTDMIPGRVNRMVIQADRPGVYRGQCAEYCGYQHAHMVLYVIADAPDDYERWAAQQRRPAATPATAEQTRGRDLFVRRNCAMCHAIDGTSAQGRHAPNLTHVASRMTIGAGTLENDTARRAAWILDPQQFKPGATMPAQNLPPDELLALNAYLGSLQ